MIEQQYLHRSCIALLILSVVFAILSTFDIRYQFYFWELFIDIKIVVVIGVLFGAWKKRWLVFSPEQFILLRFDWKTNVTIFFLPLLVYSLPIACGLTTKVLTINAIDNAATLALATLFDVPAIYMFSATSALIEEIVFRGVLLRSFRNKFSVQYALFLTNGLWTIFCISEVVGITKVTALSAFVTGLFFFSLGLFCSVLTIKNNSVWPGYSLRIGIITLTPILLTSFLAESDSFFTTNSIVLVAEGILVSTAFLAASFVLLRQINVSEQILGKRDFS
ncbi:MAG: CPBP family intramembrane glutamic endopeptidase [Bacteriovoracaceae bacterium]|nr:CPBP family intramembrane metalloprotease [Bacteroidota bacterium]